MDSFTQTRDSQSDRGKADQFGPVSLPCEPYLRFSRVRLSSWWFYLAAG